MTVGIVIPGSSGNQPTPAPAAPRLGRPSPPVVRPASPARPAPGPARVRRPADPVSPPAPGALPRRSADGIGAVASPFGSGGATGTVAGIFDPLAPAARPLQRPNPPTAEETAQAAQEAWTTQPFATPQVAIQPVGNTTLTGLPTYFRAAFPGSGLTPDQTFSTTLLGQPVTIRAASVSYTYHFGDGTTHGPTTDPGGSYPGGRITHTYTTKGVVTVRIDMTLAGQYRINDGAWLDIPGTTTVTGPPHTLTVATMQSRLHR